MNCHKAVVVGAGIGGIAAAIRLAANDFCVTLVERQEVGGGKIRGGEEFAVPIDTGPTVTTLRWVFETLFADAGHRLAEDLDIAPLETLAHHRWSDGTRLDLFADHAQTLDAIGQFSGQRSVTEYQGFCDRAERLYTILESRFMLQPQAGLLGMLRRMTLRELVSFPVRTPYQTLWNALAGTFSDPRLCQLFARYATYCGSSPFHAPATLMLIMHVERMGVWRIAGGMRALTDALLRCAKSLGVRIQYDCDVTRIAVSRRRVSGVQTTGGEFIEADCVVFNGDTAALAAGLLGPEAKSAVTNRPARRSLSAVTFVGRASVSDPAIGYHNVCFSDDYRQEFEDLMQYSRVPAQPTIYLHSPDEPACPSRRIFALVNAPANGDRCDYTAATVAAVARAASDQLHRCGIAVDLVEFGITTPFQFAERYPATGGALYGPPMHGWRAAFERPGNRTAVRGLYVAGGSVHPGSGVPMAAISGCHAANSIFEDCAVTARTDRLVHRTVSIDAC